LDYAPVRLGQQNLDPGAQAPLCIDGSKLHYDSQKPIDPLAMTLRAGE